MNHSRELGVQSRLFVLVVVCASAHVALAGEATAFQDSVQVTCKRGLGVGEYIVCDGDGWPTPVVPCCFCLAPDGSVYLVDTDGEFRLRIHRFDIAGQPLVTYLLPERVHRADGMAVTSTGDMYLYALHVGTYILCISPDGLVQARIGRNGALHSQTMRDGTQQNQLYPGPLEVICDPLNLIQVVHPAGQLHRIDTFDRKTLELVSRDVPAPPEYEARLQVLEERKALLRTHGVEHFMDAKLDGQGALWYMTYNSRFLTIHKVVFSDEIVSPDESTGPEN